MRLVLHTGARETNIARARERNTKSLKILGIALQITNATKDLVFIPRRRRFCPLPGPGYAVFSLGCAPLHDSHRARAPGCPSTRSGGPRSGSPRERAGRWRRRRWRQPLAQAAGLLAVLFLLRLVILAVVLFALLVGLVSACT